MHSITKLEATWFLSIDLTWQSYRFITTHVFFPFLPSFFDFVLVHVSILCKLTWASFTSTYFKPMETLSLFYNILACFWHDMTKISIYIQPLKFQRIIINNETYFGCHSHQVVTFIFHKNNHMIHQIKTFK